MFCVMLDAPSPVSKNVYTHYNKEICEKSITQAQESMTKAREEIGEHYGVASEDDIIDVLISCDGTWQKRGFSSLFGAVFIITYETGKVIDYLVMSKHCSGCNHWEKRDKLSDEYKEWKSHHKCDANFSGSSGAMEPRGAVTLFKRSLDHNIHYTNLISDGDSKTLSLLHQEMPYGPELKNQVQKLDCIGHVQKRMGTALCNLKVQYRGQKLSDGKTIGGVGQSTDSRINSLQKYYGDVIRRNKGDLDAMIKAVQATLLYSNSTADNPRHHLCPEGLESWCKWQEAKAQEKEYHHKDLIPEAIVQLLKLIYTRLGSRTLLEKCVPGYT